jgi:hypothetical protein
MGPRLGDSLHDPYGGLDAKTRPQGLFWRRCTTRKTCKIDLKWRKVPCERMVLFCSDASDSVRPSRRPFWQPACPFWASGDHFWPSKAPAPTGSVAVSSLSGRPAAAAGMLPWARGLEVLSRRPFWRLAHKKSGRSRGAAKKSGTHAKLHKESAGCETRTHDSFMTE